MRAFYLSLASGALALYAAPGAEGAAPPSPTLASAFESAVAAAGKPGDGRTYYVIPLVALERRASGLARGYGTDAVGFLRKRFEEGSTTTGERALAGIALARLAD